MFAKQADYTNHWYVYTAPFTPYFHNGKMVRFNTESVSAAFIASL